MPKKLDPFYPIFDHSDWVKRLVPLGIKLVQLRIKNQDQKIVRQHIRAAKAVCLTSGCQLIINDYWQLAIDEECDFIHIGQEDLREADLKAIRKAGLKFGISTYDNNELDTALALMPDYIALGPIYPTTTKVLQHSPQGLENIKRWKEKIAPIPLVGIGGLDIERGVAILKAGADSAALISDITHSQAPEQRVKQWIEATKPWR